MAAPSLGPVSRLRPAAAALVAALQVALQVVAAAPAHAAAGSVSVADVSERESNAAITFAITRTGGTDGGVAVTYTTQEGTAKDGQDYLGTTDTVIFGQGQTVKRVRVNIVNDALNEDNERFSFVITRSDTIVTDDTAIGTIEDDDLQPRLSVVDVTVTEGNAGNTMANFVVSLDPASGRTVTVDYRTDNGTATAPTDYEAITSGTLTFNPGETIQSVPVPVVGDQLDEADTEAFTFNLSNPGNAGFLKASATGTIADDDGPPSLSVDDVTVAEDGGQAHFTLTLSPASGRVVSVNYATVGGTATAGQDYTSTNDEITFNPGDTVKGFDVDIINDTKDEPNETFTVSLSDAQGATVAKPTGTGTITDDDPGPELSIDNVTGFENAGIFRFTVTLTGATSQLVTVNYATAPGSATADVDYVSQGVPLPPIRFLPGSGTRTAFIDVTINEDVFAEADEDFTVNLSDPTGGATIKKAAGRGVIRNNDGEPAQVSIGDAQPIPLIEAAGNATFTVSLSGPVPQAVSVTYATKDGTAVTGSDYTNTFGVLTFAPNQTTKTITVAITNDNLDEEDSESFTVELSNPINAVFVDASGAGAIVDDDLPPVVSVAGVDIPEGDNDSAVVSLNTASGRTVKVNFTVADGTAKRNADYTAQAGDTITFAPGETRKPIPISTADDALDEEDRETLTVTLSAPANATIGTSPATVGILDNDDPPVLSIANAEPVEEPAAGQTTEAYFAVRLSAVSGRPVTFHVATDDVPPGDTPSDYAPLSRDVTIPAGQLGPSIAERITVTVKGDGSVDEQPSETFTVMLSNPVNATVNPPGAATGTILDSDGPPTLTITGTTVSEGNADADVNLTVRLVPAIETSEVRVDYATADGSAVTPDDYLQAGGTLIFPPGETAQTFNVRLKGDGLDEADEVFSARLDNPTGGATIDESHRTAQVSILDDDGPAISVADATVTEGDAAVSAVFVISLSAASAQPVTVDYATSNATATAPKDYARTTGTLTFNPGEVAKPIPVEVAGDNEDEADETFTLRLSNPTNATIGRAAGTGTILDDDQPTLAFSAPTVAEGDFGETGLTFTLTLDAFTTREVSVDYATADGTARAGVDYVPAKGSLTFTPGETTKRVVVAVTGDSRPETDETFLLRLSGASNVTIGGGGVATILDDDRPGYALVATDGGIFAFGGADFAGSTGSMRLNQPIVGMAAHPSGRGYWLVATDGGVFTFGEARFHGSTGSLRLNKPIVGMAATPTGNGYWLVASDGGIFAFGDAKFRGSTGSLRLNKPIVDMAATPSGEGYWLVASDGGIFAFNAPFKGSTGSITLNKPIVGMAATPSGEGYWLVASDGGIFAFNAPFKGSTGSMRLNQPIVGMAATPSGNGYWMVATDGGIFAFGDAAFLGSTGSMRLNRPVVGMAIL